jgi:hypothetical protein
MEEPTMPMPMTRPEALTGSGRGKNARLLDDTDVDRLIAQAEGEEGEEGEEDEDDEDKDTESEPA